MSRELLDRFPLPGSSELNQLDRRNIRRHLLMNACAHWKGKPVSSARLNPAPTAHDGQVLPRALPSALNRCVPPNTDGHSRAEGITRLTSQRGRGQPGEAGARFEDGRLTLRSATTPPRMTSDDGTPPTHGSHRFSPARCRRERVRWASSSVRTGAVTALARLSDRGSARNASSSAACFASCSARA